MDSNIQTDYLPGGFSIDHWNPQRYNVCTVTDECIDYDFPYECVRELSLAGFGCRVGHIARNYNMFKLIYGIAGIEARHSMMNISPEMKVFSCPQCDSPYGSSPWVVDHIYSSISKPAFVTQSIGCNCLRYGAVYDRSWKETIGLKYESMYLVGCAVAMFFGRRINYFPKGIETVCDSEGGNGVVELTYHKSIPDGNEQVLRLEVCNRNGGFYIQKDPLEWKSRIQFRSCVVCRFRNGDLNGCRMIFGLDCGRHGVCEKCVFGLLASVNPIVPGFQNGWCGVCCSGMDRKVHVELGSVKCFRAPVPCGFFGKKPVFSPILYAQLGPMYQHHIEWAVTGRKEAGDALASCRDQLENEKASLVALGSNTNSSSTSVDSVNKCIRLLEASCEKWERVVTWLDSRVEYFNFALDIDIPYPKSFLAQDMALINRKLEKREYELLRNKAICSHWNAETHLREA